MYIIDILFIIHVFLNIYVYLYKKIDAVGLQQLLLGKHGHVCLVDCIPSPCLIAVPARSHCPCTATFVLPPFRTALTTLPPLYGLAWEGMIDGRVISTDGLEVQGSPFPLPGAFSAAKRLLGMCWLCSLSQGQEHLGPKRTQCSCPPEADGDRGICPSNRDPLNLNEMQKIICAFIIKGWEEAGSFWSGETFPCVLISFQMVGSIN